MLERTQIFVDTSYLLASFYNSWEIGARAQLEIDLPEVVATLGSMVSTHLGQPVHRQLWYDGIPDSGPHRYQRALRTCDGVQLRAGQLIAWGDRRTQKAVDTRLVADMVLAGVRREFTDIVLVSGDADMIPGVQEAVNAGVRVHLYGFGWDSMSSALRHACDSTTILDPREDFADCMQLEILEGPLPPVVKPTSGEEDATQESQEDADTAAAPSTDSDSQNLEFEQDDFQTMADRTAQATDERDDEQDNYAEDIAAHVQEPADRVTPSPTPRPTPPTGGHSFRVTSRVEESVEVSFSPFHEESESEEEQRAEITIESPASPRPAPNPSMMAPRRKLRSRYVPLPNEVWASDGTQTPFDVGQQYAIWWYDNAATAEQRDSAHLLSGGGLPPEIDRPLLQFACETLHEYTLTEAQRVNLRDGFHTGIKGILLNGS